MNFNDIISFIDQCDDMPPQCFDGTWMCTCQSFLMPVLLGGIVGVSVLVLTIVRMFSKDKDFERVERI